jgi:hypothetical protein
VRFQPEYRALTRVLSIKSNVVVVAIILAKDNRPTLGNYLALGAKPAKYKRTIVSRKGAKQG